MTQTWEEPLKAECRAFLSAMESGLKPITSGEEGLRVLKILEISQQSIEQKESTPSRLTPHTSLAIDSSHLTPHPSQVERSYFVDETSIVDNAVEIGTGTRIWHFSHVLSNSNIGENCNIGQNVVIGPDVTIGNNCKIQNNVSVYKGVTLEDGVFCGPSMLFTNIINPRAEIRKMDQVRPTLVKHGATLGANCTIICGTTIGRYAFIGAGAVVTHNVPDHALMLGNAARRAGWMCQCGERLTDDLECLTCEKTYVRADHGLSEIEKETEHGQ